MEIITDLVIDARMINSSGIGVYIENIIKCLDGLKPVLLGRPDELGKKFGNLPVVAFDVPIYSVKEQRLYSKIIPACGLFWSPHYNVPLLPVRAKKRLVTIHDVYHLAYFKQLGLAQKIYSKLVMGAATRLSEAVITVSDFSKNEIVKYTGCGTDKITRIYNGVVQNNTATDKSLLVKKYSLPDNYLLFVGNVKAHKNVKKFLQAYMLLHENLRSVYNVVIVGKKDGFITGDQSLFEWISSDGYLRDKIIFTGFAENEHLDSIYANATLLVFPSIYEGFGLPLLEAMKNKCATIASNLPSFKEVAGDASIYFDPFDEQDIAAKITDVLQNENLRNRLIIEGEARARLFTWEQSAKEHLKLFEKLLV